MSFCFFLRERGASDGKRFDRAERGMEPNFRNMQVPYLFSEVAMAE
jgi:hypothetical protein